MKKTNKILALFLALLLAAILCACGAESMSQSADRIEDYWTDDMKTEEAPAVSPEYDDYYDEVIEEEGMSTADSAAGATTAQPNISAEKIIYSGYVNLETTAFDQSLTALSQTVAQNGGFIQDSNVQGNTRYNNDGTTSVVDRWASYTIRIPSENFESFMAMTNGIGNVTSSNRNAQNVTSQYTDYEARLSSLTIQEERLLDMLKQTKDLDSLITLEARLSEVRYEIESIERNLRNLDNRIAYSTVTVNIQEVEIYTPTTPVTRTFGEKMSDAFSDGWTDFVRGLQDLCIWLAEALPVLVILLVQGVAALVIVILIRKKIRKKAAVKVEKED